MTARDDDHDVPSQEELDRLKISFIMRGVTGPSTKRRSRRATPLAVAAMAANSDAVPSQEELDRLEVSSKSSVTDL